MQRKMMAIGALLVVAGCGGSAGGGAGGGADSARTARTQTAAERCGAGRDSTRAACLAFDTLRLGRAPSTLHLVQHGATFCVHTGPGPRPAAEGEAVVEVVAHRVTRVSLADRSGCGP